MEPIWISVKTFWAILVNKKTKENYFKFFLSIEKLDSKTFLSKLELIDN